ncbi:unnamed protein product [Adineta steineri]|uniref:Uncharacterized protein n=1 Tax=Adineta steineri TaxID=433720 RepID=A0A814YLV4_9BILA|nr:unnamed protein product [Adineta steineri]CAF1231750.1 unnamed protein product [Adineta steineri]
MPVLDIERPRLKSEMHNALKRHVLRERQRKKDEADANEADKQRRRAEKAKTLSSSKVQLEHNAKDIFELERILIDLEEKKSEQYNLLKCALTEEDQRKHSQQTAAKESSWTSLYSPSVHTTQYTHYPQHELLTNRSPSQSFIPTTASANISSKRSRSPYSSPSNKSLRPLNVPQLHSNSLNPALTHPSHNQASIFPLPHPPSTFSSYYGYMTPSSTTANPTSTSYASQMSHIRGASQIPNYLNLLSFLPQSIVDSKEQVTNIYPHHSMLIPSENGYSIQPSKESYSLKMNDTYKNMKDQLLSDTIPISDRDSHERTVRKRTLTRPRSEPSLIIDPKTNTYYRNPSHQSYGDLRDHTDDLIDTVLEVPTKCVEQAKEVGKLVVQYVVDHSHLPHWLLDNEYLLSGHRPPMPSFKQCFASIFRLHTETVNIWTHLLGTLVFIVIAIYFSTRPSTEIHMEKKIIFGAFFLGAIICLLCSTLYHTLYCHSPKISKFFSKLDYCGIAILIIGSIIPLLYYQFYCEFGTKLAYLTLIGVLGIGCIVISMWDKFNSPEYRVYRALLFITFGVFGFIPTCHYILRFGVEHAFTAGATQYLLLVAALYGTGACIYAIRIPERLAPGVFDIWFQSHQLFHIFVVVAACVHYYGICILSHNQTNYFGDCRNILNSDTTPISSLIT